jgi:CO dehydrogenase/acetyl-CoA synthase epsilon subunit
MGKIVIKKRITLEFLGDEYKDCYLEFNTIPMKDYIEYVKKASQAKGEAEASQYIIDALTPLFVSGKFLENDELFDVTKDQIQDFNVETLVTAFNMLTGQTPSPN